MHKTAMENCRQFFDVYADYFHQRSNVKVLEIGSQDVNGSLREVCPGSFEYVGADFQRAKGVDVVLDDPYALPFESGSVDIVLSSSCFEHSDMFWLVFLEVLRVLKRGGIFYLNAPSAGPFHRYPVDCWRFYPDSGMALVKWAKRNSMNAILLESYTQKCPTGWQDFVSVFLKDESVTPELARRIIDSKVDYENGSSYPNYEIRNHSAATQNDTLIKVLSERLKTQADALDKLQKIKALLG